MASVTAFTGTIPQHYETYLGPLFFEPYAKDLLQHIGGSDFRSVLELASGTGRVTKHLLGKLAPNGRLYATDLNEDMLAVAKKNLQDKRIEWAVADAHELPFHNDQFDLVVCQFGIMFFQDKPNALREVFRVLEQGKRFYFNTWDRIENNAVANTAWQTVNEIFPDDLPLFLRSGPHSLFDPAVVRQLLADAGFTNIKIELVEKTSVAASPDDVLKGFLEGTTLYSYLAERSARFDDVRQRFRELLVQRYGESNLPLPMKALVCSAAKG